MSVGLGLGFLGAPATGGLVSMEQGWVALRPVLELESGRLISWGMMPV